MLAGTLGIAFTVFAFISSGLAAAGLTFAIAAATIVLAALALKAVERFFQRDTRYINGYFGSKMRVRSYGREKSGIIDFSAKEKEHIKAETANKKKGEWKNRAFVAAIVSLTIATVTLFGFWAVVPLITNIVAFQVTAVSAVSLWSIGSAVLGFNVLLKVYDKFSKRSPATEGKNIISSAVITFGLLWIATTLFTFNATPLFLILYFVTDIVLKIGRAHV